MIFARTLIALCRKVSAVAVLWCVSQAASALELAPYFESWSGKSLVQAKEADGLNSATLAFAITRGNCSFTPGFLSRLADARQYADEGGQLIVSLGGQKGVYAEAACQDEDQFFTLLQELLIDSGARWLDWDVEGKNLLDLEATGRRARALAKLQAEYPGLRVSFTLPGWLRGLGANSIQLLNATLAAGVRIDRVNVMTMTFGLENLRTMVTPPTLAQASIMAFNATADQLALVYPNKTRRQLHAMMGMTPMIGKNNDGSVFTLEDARTIASFARQHQIGLLSYWSYQRDRAQAESGIGPLHVFSGVGQSNFQFYEIFKSAAGDVRSVPLLDGNK